MVEKLFIFYCVCIVYGLIENGSTSALFKSKEIIVQVDVVENCGNTSGYSLVFIRVVQGQAPDGVPTYYGEAVVKKEIPIKSSMMVTVEKCKYKERPDTCERFMPFKTSKHCDLMYSNSHGLTSLRECLTPDFKCPVKKGTYIGRNCTVDLNEFRMFPLAGWYWKLQAEIFVADKRVACVSAAARVITK